MRPLGGTIPEHVARRIARLRPLDAALRECLPTDCAAHARAAGIRGDTFYIVADSPAWRARIRFHSGSIIRQINGLSNAAVRQVIIRVGQPEAPNPAPYRRPQPKTIPASAARGLASLATVTDDPELQAVLYRLAARRREP